MQVDAYQYRQKVMMIFFAVIALLLLGRVFELQVLDESYQKQQSFRQTIVQYPSRGLIYDRNGKLLVYNYPIYDLMATYSVVKKSNIDTAAFCQLLGISKERFVTSLEKDFKGDYRFSKRKPFEFMSKISADTFAQLEERLYQFRGFEPVRRSVRGYAVSSAAHVLGYIGEVSPQQIERSQGFYHRGEYIGVSGLENYYEEQLRGKRGAKNVLRDKWGRTQGSYRNGEFDEQSEAGFDMISSIDLELQQYAESLMVNKRGALVAIEPSTGEILAMVSAPYYDPNILVFDQKRKEAFAKLLTDSLNPLFNRALMAKYPPGSIFKTILAAIALQERVIMANTGMGCGGGYRYGNLRVGCHGHPGIGSVSAAIQYSCNNYFCQTFKELVNMYGFDYPEKGLGKLSEHLAACGLGHKLGVDIPNEVGGNIPTPAYYDKRLGAGRWRFSNFVSVGIGQGEVEITPLQMANITAVIANRGFYYIPHFAKEFKGDTSQILAKYKTPIYSKVHPSHFEPVVKGMQDVVIAGTGRRAQISDIVVCGKTGTVENRKGKDHSTFIAFAPRDNPKIVVAVYVENGGFGSTYAAPISSLIIEKYIRREIVGAKRLALQQQMFSANLLYSGVKATAAATVRPATIINPEQPTIISPPNEGE
jgi:penicillin-binding protein 2